MSNEGLEAEQDRLRARDSLIPFVPAGWLGAEGELLDSPEVTHLQPGVVFSLKDDLPAIPPYQADDNEL